MQYKIFLIFILSFILSSCSFKKHSSYVLNDLNNSNVSNTWFSPSLIQNGDELSIVIINTFSETNQSFSKDDVSYLVNDDFDVFITNIGKVNVKGMSIITLEEKIKNILIERKLLINPIVKVNYYKPVFSVIGEVNSAGTFPFLKKNVNIYQALGYANGISISGRKDKITLIREKNNKRVANDIFLNRSDILTNKLYNIMPNDIIIVHPTLARTKNQGFLGNPTSITNIASFVVTLTVLLLNIN